MKVHEAIEEILNNNIVDYKKYRTEAVSRCPFCGSDKKKFYINLETGMYNCKLGSCGEKGNLTTLIRHFGLDINVEYDDYSSGKK